jgi:hypothetical protein
VFAQRGYCTDQGTHGGWPAVDAFAPRGTHIYAPYSGRVEAYQYKGNNIAYLYPDPGQTPCTAFFFAHGNVPFKTGRWAQREVVGQVGNTGALNTPYHVHFSGATDGNVSRGPSRGSGNVWFEPWTWGVGVTPPPPPPPLPTPRFKTMGNLNLRKNPGTDSEVIKVLPAGTVVHATIQDSHPWRKVKVKDAEIWLPGWVADDLLEKL